MASSLYRARFDRFSLVIKRSLGYLHVSAGGTLAIGRSRTLYITQQGSHFVENLSAAFICCLDLYY